MDPGHDSSLVCHFELDISPPLSSVPLPKSATFPFRAATKRVSWWVTFFAWFIIHALSPKWVNRVRKSSLSEKPLSSIDGNIRQVYRCHSPFHARACSSSSAFVADNRRTALALCDPSLWMAHACFALLGGSFQVIKKHKSGTDSHH